MKDIMNSKMAALKIQNLAVIQKPISMYILVYVDSRKWIIDFVPTNLASDNPVPMSVDQFTTYRKIRLNVSDQNCRSVLFRGRGAVSPSSTMWTGPRPTSTPSAMLIHPAVWPDIWERGGWVPI